MCSIYSASNRAYSLHAAWLRIRTSSQLIEIIEVLLYIIVSSMSRCIELLFGRCSFGFGEGGKRQAANPRVPSQDGSSVWASPATGGAPDGSEITSGLRSRSGGLGHRYGQNFRGFACCKELGPGLRYILLHLSFLNISFLLFLLFVIFILIFSPFSLTQVGSRVRRRGLRRGCTATLRTRISRIHPTMFLRFETLGWRERRQQRPDRMHWRRPRDRTMYVHQKSLDTLGLVRRSHRSYELTCEPLRYRDHNYRDRGLACAKANKQTPWNCMKLEKNKIKIHTRLTIGKKNEKSAVRNTVDYPNRNQCIL